jgi:hypothetical protein
MPASGSFEDASEVSAGTAFGVLVEVNSNRRTHDKIIHSAHRLRPNRPCRLLDASIKRVLVIVRPRPMDFVEVGAKDARF